LGLRSTSAQQVLQGLRELLESGPPARQLALSWAWSLAL